MTELDLTKLRQEIDRLDAILTDTLEKRMDVVQQVAAYKDARNMQVLDREREEQVIAKVVGMLKNPAYAPHMKRIMEKIMETSRNLQIDILAANIKQKEQNADPIRVGYQGVKGSFSHQALEDCPLRTLPPEASRKCMTWCESMTVISSGKRSSRWIRTCWAFPVPALII